MDFITITIQALKTLADICGNWGLAIILFTVIIRFLLWPFNVSQQKSMRDMQKLQPKIKALQERYKSNPEMMQQKLMEFYKEHKFNPMAGCLPLLLQLPVFILLYTALMSPQFISLAGKTNFLFVPRLDATIKSNTGVSFDGEFEAGKTDKFAVDKTVKVYLKDGKEIDNVKVTNPMKAIQIQGELDPGEAIEFKIPMDNLKLSFEELDKIQKAEVNVINMSTKEMENITFTRRDSILMGDIPSAKIEAQVHYDVIILVVLFILTMWLSTKIMTMQNKNKVQDELQEKMQKQMSTMMPIMVGVMFIFLPIPAGVLLYLITSNIFQIVQTVIVNKQLDAAEGITSSTVNTDISDAKKIQAKEIKDIDKKN